MYRNKKAIISIWVVVLIVATFLFPINIDTVYNFTFAHNIKSGMIPYRDFNMIITPLCAYITSIFLFIYDNVIVINLLMIPVCGLIYYLSFKILKIFKLPDISNLLLNAIFSILVVFIAGFSYNLFCLILWEFCIYYILDLNIKKNIIYKDLIILGLVCSICILFKQTTGMILTFGIFVNLFILFIRYKINIFKNLFIFAISVIIPLIGFMLFLFVNGALEDFLDQTVFGISNFVPSEKIIAFYTIIAILTLICLVSFYLYFKLKDFNIIILFIFSVLLTHVVYPLPNYSHCIMGIMGLILLICIFLNVIFKKYIILVSFLLSFCLYCLFIINGQKVLDEKVVNSNQKYFKNCLIDIETENNINLLIDYMNANSENTYYIITENSQMFHLNMDIYYKYYDLFFMGNIGTNNYIDLIKNIEQDYIIVYTNPDDDFFQIDPDCLDYIRSLKKVDEIGVYSVYSAVD